MLRSPLSMSRTKISPLGGIISNYSFYQSRFPPTFAKTGNFIGWSTGKKRTRDVLICASSCVTGKRCMAVPEADGYGGFHGGDPSTLEEPAWIGILRGPSPGRSTTTCMKLHRSGVAPSRVPVRRSLEHRLAAARRLVLTRRMMQGPLDFILVVAAAMRVAVSVSGSSVRRSPVIAGRLAD